MTEAGETVSPDGTVLSWQACGQRGKPEILFVHGLNQSRLSWDRQVSSSLRDRFRLVTFDLRGHGDSGKPSQPAAYADAALWAGDLLAVMDAAKLRRPMVVGWSLGALVAGFFVRAFGDARIAGINLAAGVVRPGPGFVSEAAITFAGLLQSPRLHTRVQATRDFLRACFSRPPEPDELAEMLVVNGMVPRALHQGLGGLSIDGLDEAWAIPKRMLLSYGAEDKLLRSSETIAHALAQNPGARVSLYTGIGHAPMWEDPERFNAELAAFVDGTA